MNPIQRLAGQFLYWTQVPAFSMDYLLQDAEAVQTLATLKWQSSLAMRDGVTLGTQAFFIESSGVPQTPD